MSSDLHTDSGATATQLLSGIVSDAQDLMKQQLALFRSEVREDFQKTKQATLLMVGGLVIAQLAAMLVCWMFVHLLAASFPDIPLWACFGIVGGVLALIGGGLALASMSIFKSFNPLPDQTAQSVKENVQWMTNPK
jgi:peptidoglycan biosynthesis protein MviN/MurJ (putative lipid II flippase)